MRSGPNTDYYAVLGVNPDASGDELKTAFRTRGACSAAGGAARWREV